MTVSLMCLIPRGAECILCDSLEELKLASSGSLWIPQMSFWCSSSPHNLPRLYCPRVGRALIAMLVSTVVAPLLGAKPCQSAAHKACEPPGSSARGRNDRKSEQGGRTGEDWSLPGGTFALPDPTSSFQKLLQLSRASPHPNTPFPSCVVFKC